MPFGIALAGGGAKGAAHIGVLLALEEEGFLPESIAGASAGALVAGLYATGTTPAELKKIACETAENSGPLFDPDIRGVIRAIPNLILKHNMDFSGLVKGDRLERYLCEKTGGKSIRETKIKTIIPAVDINSGDTVAYTSTLNHLQPLERVRWKSDVPICEAMRASSAYPAVFRPKQMDGMCLVDGGVADVLPIDLLRASGEKNVLAVDIAEDYKAPKCNNLFEISSHCISIMCTRLKECRTHGEKVLLTPSLPPEAGLLTLEQIPACIDAGYRAARENMAFIRAHLA